MGRIVLLGIVLGILLVLVVAASASVALAQEMPATVKGAPPYPDNAVCKGWQMFESFALEHRIEDAGLNQGLTSVRGQLRDLCHQSPGREDIGSGSGVGWLTMVDHIFDTLTMSLYDRMNRPVSAKERIVLRDLLRTTALFQRDFELMRIDAYQAVLIETKEVVRTVEVPAKCVPVEPPPPPRDPCADALRQGASRWYSQLYKWTDSYRGSGSDWALADSSKNDLLSIARGSGDPRSYVIGWLAQWRSVRRSGSESFLGSGPMPQIAADMRAQLASCGVYAGEE
jgi:hypothetical protein